MDTSRLQYGNFKVETEWKQHDFALKFQLFLSELKLKIVQCTNRVIYPDVSTFSTLAPVPIGNSLQGTVTPVST